MLLYTFNWFAGGDAALIDGVLPKLVTANETRVRYGKIAFMYSPPESCDFSHSQSVFTVNVTSRQYAKSLTDTYFRPEPAPLDEAVLNNTFVFSSAVIQCATLYFMRFLHCSRPLEVIAI